MTPTAGAAENSEATDHATALATAHTEASSYCLRLSIRFIGAECSVGATPRINPAEARAAIFLDSSNCEGIRPSGRLIRILQSPSLARPVSAW